MKRLLVLAVLACAGGCALSAQVVDTTVCDVLKNPKSFDGKMVRIKATVSAGFDQFIVRGPDCGQPVDAIWLAYPQGTKGKAGPDAVLELQPAHNFAGKFTAPTRAAVTIEKDKEFKQFDSLLAQTHNKGAGMCLGCRRYEVSATLVGRLDGVSDATLERDASGKIVGFGGFGNMNAYPARLVLQSVSDVSPKEVDYSKSDAATKGDTQTFAGSPDLYDPVDAARKSAAAIGSAPAGIQAQKDAAAFPARGEHNGVIVLNGPGNEASEKADGMGEKDSPDGVLFNCTLNNDHLQGDAELRAYLHMGQHIEELRNPQPGDAGAPLFILESNAWAVTVSAAMGNRQRFLTLPGGYLVWDADWPAANRLSNFDDALKNYLANEALLSR